MWQPGQRIGDYELVADLRSGGMATLFLGRRLGAAGFSRDVAIKIVHPQLASDEQFRQMFLDEAMLSSRIQHPNVVHVEELGEHAGAHFLVMEYVHGCSLSQLQRALVGRGRRLAPAFATRIAMHVAEALHAAHETRDQNGRRLNVVHRDVSPENVLLAYAGHVKLIDFGIAKAYGRRHRTQDGLLKGKFRYMAPEQAYGKEIDRRTDIYQLGIVLWELLTLRRLFDAENDGALLQQVREPRVVAPSSLVGRIPAALDAAVLCALDPNPERRPPDAQHFARMLGKALSEAHEVDAGALSALVMATMQEHRAREKGTFPPHVHERLEREVQTERIGGEAERAAPAVIRQYTLEHTAPYGSDVPVAAPARARAGGLSADQAASAAGHAQLPQPRPRRLVRIASEIKTTITRITRSTAGEAGGRPMLWLALLVAIVLGGAAALVTLALRSRPVSPPSSFARVPALPAQLTPDSHTPDPNPNERARPEQPSSALAPFAPSDTPSDVAARGFETPASPAPAMEIDGARELSGAAASEPGTGRGKLSAPVQVDGTPLVLEPGF